MPNLRETQYKTLIESYVSRVNSFDIKKPTIDELKTIDTGIGMVNFGWGNAKTLLEIKPILRPLSELNVESIESTLFGKMSDNIAEWFKYFDSDSQNKDIAILQAPYPVLEYCFENHFDVFSLIKNGLAIDINTL